MRAFIIATTTLIFLCACASSGAQPTKTTVKSSPSALAAFSHELFVKTAKPGENTLISPLSVAMALGMVENGASGKTLDEFQMMLGAKDGTNSYYASIIKSFISDNTTSLNIFNAVYINNKTAPKGTFLDSLKKYYRANAYYGSFSDGGIVNKINNDVAATTNNLITKIIDSLSDNDKMVLLNTLYFKAPWQTPFEPYATHSGDFYSPADKISADFMVNTAQYPYYEGKNFTAVALPYKGNRFAMLLFLPSENTSVTDILMQTADLQTIYGEMYREHIHLTLPKFTMESNYTLNDALASIGIPTAFNAGKAEFTNIMDTPPLYISQVVHKTKLIADEAGTEAAAATAIMIRATSMPLINKTITFDRPFAFAVWDDENKIPLFLGVVAKP